jgi:hypothetical protein
VYVKNYGFFTGDKSMAKKVIKPSSDQGKEKKVARVTCTSYLRDLYEQDKNMSNEKALKMLLAKFPNSNAGSSSISTWKCMFREEGMDIPKLRRAEGAASKTAKKVAKKKV